MVATNYIVTVQRPTQVTALATGYFTSSNELNLIVAKNTHFEIYIIGSEGLKLVKDVCLYGRINVLKFGQDEFSCIVIGRNSIGIYKENEQILEIDSPLLQETTSLISYCPIDDGRRYLVTDDCGKLYLLILESNKHNGSSSTTITDLKLNLLGEISISRYIIYLDNSVAFIGSNFGDSQLIRLLPEPQNGSHLELLESYTNLGPILDMSIIDLERQDRQLVTCSGYAKDSSLRFIRTGIGIHEHASIDLRNIKGIWALKIDNQYDNHLVVAFFDQTRLFHLQNDEIEEIELPAFDFQHQTLFCTNVTSNQYLQITTYSIRLIGNNGQNLLLEWKNENNEITVASSNQTQCVCAIGNELFYFEIGPASLKEISKCQLPYNIACLDITPLNSRDERTNLCVIGLWTQISVWICRLPTLDILHRESLTSDTLPRSVAMITFDGQPYVFVSLADGPIVYYLLDIEHGLLYERKKVPLGTKPTTLTICQHTDLSSTSNNSRTVLFACSDHPSVISSTNNKLVFSSVNLREIVCMCSFNSEYYGPSLTLVTDMGVILGRIDDIQKLHVRSLILGESVKRIAYMDEEKIYIILTQYMDLYQTDNIAPIKKMKELTEQQQQDDAYNSIVVLDQHTHEAHTSVKLLNNEEATSLCVLTFADDPSIPYIAVGTTIVFNDEDVPKCGRLILFRYKNGHMNMVAEKELNDIPYRMLPFQGKLLVSIGTSIRLYKFSLENHELIQLSKTSIECVECLELKVKDDFILTGDLMRSLTVLRYNVDENKFENIAHDPHPQWTKACEFIDDDTFVCAEDGGNIVSCHKNSGSTKEQERNILNELGSYHLGEEINLFRRGCLVTQQTSESAITLETCILMGAISGYIGLLLQLPPTLYKLLMSLQLALAEYVPSVGKIDHGTWRSFDSDGRSNVSSGFVDGDLIETYLDLPKTVQHDLIKDLHGENNVQLNATVEELVKIIEELARIH
ncbi:unnamed protein product [Rotaria sordida]|uniref:DNA damage-binding protein 1 n=1 Tax=Rotaria sordida TaxID=392033 RepID=A0A814DUB3_9BILA|nr:unnamed protein product [Rotaria sordida]